VAFQPRQNPGGIDQSLIMYLVFTRVVADVHVVVETVVGFDTQVRRQCEKRLIAFVRIIIHFVIRLLAHETQIRGNVQFSQVY